MKKKSYISCPQCKFSCTSTQNLRIHFQQTNHKPRKFQGSRTIHGSAYQAEDPAVSNPGTLPEDVRNTLVSLKDYIDRKGREPLIGMEYILEYRVQFSPEKIDIKYYCELCHLDCGVIPIVDHLVGLKHKKMYLAKEYPYVLKASSNGKEDRTEFLKRMTMEIEREEGLKMYKIDPVIRNVAIMNVKASEAKHSKRRTRWDAEGSKQARMKKALEYLESFEIDNDTEASTVTRLTEKLTAELKLYSNKLEEEVAFPRKVAKAKNVAISIMQGKTKPPSLLSIELPAQPENLKDKVGVPFVLPAPSVPGSDQVNWAPAFPPASVPPPFLPETQKPGIPEMPQAWPLQAPFLPGNQQPNMQGMPAVFQQGPLQAPFLSGNQQPNMQGMPAVFQQGLQQASFLPANQHPNMQGMPPVFPQVPPPVFPQVPTQAPFLTANMQGMPAVFQQGLQQAQFLPGNQNLNIQQMPGATIENVQKNQAAESSLNAQSDSNSEELKFLKKLMALLSALPENTTSSDTSQFSSKLTMLKSLLSDKTPNTNATAANQQVMMQVASLTQGVASTENVSQNKQLMIMASQNTADMAGLNQNLVMQMASMANNVMPVENAQANQKSLMQMAALLQDRQSINTNSLMPSNQTFKNQDYAQEDNSMRLVDQNVNQNVYMDPQSRYANASQSYGDFGYGASTVGNFYESGMGQYGDNTKSMVLKNKPTQSLHSGINSGAGDEKVRNPKSEDYASESPYTRVSLSPKTSGTVNKRFHNANSDLDLRKEIHSQEMGSSHGKHSSRAFEDPEWSERESGKPYNKRPRLDTEHGAHQPRENDFQGRDLSNLSLDLLKRIRGKDVFTASAILSEYADSHASK
ncbi:uncharacterized protein [Hyperolius riggenbachi]|uniref:uncharacterized protein isoform X2 n=1 Tax=Hyperolius riggenbachi TaxID=752182 RepID=UPI0035A3CBAE